MKYFLIFLLIIGLIGSLFCGAVGIIGYQRTNPARWSEITGASIGKYYISTDIRGKARTVFWAPIIEVIYTFKNKEMSGAIRLTPFESELDAKLALKNTIRKWNGCIYVYITEPQVATLKIQPQSYYIQIMSYGIPFLLLVIISIYAQFRKKKPNQAS